MILTKVGYTAVRNSLNCVGGCTVNKVWKNAIHRVHAHGE